MRGVTFQGPLDARGDDRPHPRRMGGPRTGSFSRLGSGTSWRGQGDGSNDDSSTPTSSPPPGGRLGIVASRVIVGATSEREAQNSLAALKTLVERNCQRVLTCNCVWLRCTTGLFPRSRREDTHWRSFVESTLKEIESRLRELKHEVERSRSGPHRRWAASSAGPGRPPGSTRAGGAHARAPRRPRRAPLRAGLAVRADAAAVTRANQALELVRDAAGDHHSARSPSRWGSSPITCTA